MNTKKVLKQTGKGQLRKKSDLKADKPAPPELSL